MHDDFEVQPLGTLPIHLWRCHGAGCHNVWEFEISGTGEFSDITREEMKDHVRETGHEVQYVHGTMETLASLRTKEKS